MPNITQQLANRLKRDCWCCEYQKLGGFTITGYCGWFEENGKDKKEIPPDKVDYGCRYWRNKVDKYYQ